MDEYRLDHSSSVVLSENVVGVGRSARFAAHEGPQYSLFACYAFTVNYILGVGSLGMPFAVQEAGWVAALLLIAVVSLLSYVTVLMVARAALRAELLQLEPCEANPTGKWCYVRCIATRGEPQLHDGESMCANCFANCSAPPHNFEVIQLCDKFLGPSGRLCYQLALILLMYAGLLAYVLVFVDTVDILGHHRDISVLICAAVMLPLSVLNVTEMVPLQVTLSLISLFSLLLMGSIALGNIASDPASNIHPLQPVRPTGFGLAFSTALFSQLFQHSVPGLINPLRQEDRQRVPHVFAFALCTTAVLYIFLGLCCAISFGQALNEDVNLNFANFDWGSRPPFIAKAASKVCAFYPALATIAVFPLIAITLGNNLLVVAPLPKAVRLHHPRKVTVLFRLLAAVPPIVLALLLKSLSTVFKFAGLGGIWVAFVTPALLQLYSFRAVNAHFEEIGRSRSRSAGSPELGNALAANGRDVLRPEMASSPEVSRIKRRDSLHNVALRTPLYPRFNKSCWAYVVLASAVLAFAITTWGIVVDLLNGN